MADEQPTDEHIQKQPRDDPRPHLDPRPDLRPGPDWRELQPPLQWDLRSILVFTTVAACFFGGWARGESWFPATGVAVIATVCYLFIDRRLCLWVVIVGGIPASVVLFLGLVISQIVIAPP